MTILVDEEALEK